MRYRKKYAKTYRRGPYGYGAVIVGTPEVKVEDVGSTDFNITRVKDQEHIGAVLGVFKDGDSLILPTPDNDCLPVLRHFPLKGTETLQLTAAYRLQDINFSRSWRDFILPSTDVDVNELTKDIHERLPEWPILENDVLMNWHLRRNLEHILSVCCMPLEKGINNPVKPVALTCGDFGDHRVSVPGSFFAFRFLLSMHKHLDEPRPQDLRLDSLRLRIREACRGHLQWVFEAEIGEDGFDSNYWVKGNIIEEKNRRTIVQMNSPTNMPTQILKACEYLEVFQENDDFTYVTSWLSPFIKKWFKLLNKTKNRLALTWQHSSESVIATFQLDDHMWIWKALESIERLVVKVKEQQIRSPHANLEVFLKIENHLASTGKRQSNVPATERWEYHSTEVRKQILRKFTTENDITKKRTLAVTRSAQETRFLFHSRDTALYYGLEWGFFADSPHVWQNLVEAQALHDEGNDELLWDNPLRYALAIRMAFEGHTIDKAYSPSEMKGRARSVLLDSSTANGLFPGQLDDVSKEAKLFDRRSFRGFYFYAGFEISCILLWVSEQETAESVIGESNIHESGDGFETSRAQEVKAKIDEPTLETTPHQASDPQPRRQSMSTHIVLPLSTSGRVEHPLSTLDQRGTIVTGRRPSVNVDVDRGTEIDGRPFYPLKSLKRLIPFSKSVDSSNIVELTEEWLYSYPKFLDFELPTYDYKFLENITKDERRKERSIIEEGAKISQKLSPTASLEHNPNDPIESRIFHNDKYSWGFVRDVARHKRKNSRAVEHSRHYKSPREFWQKLKGPREAEQAKKRIIYLGPGDPQVALICWLASPDAEKEHISRFFDRHSTSRGFFIDDTTAAHNTWETEIHLNFFQLIENELVANEKENTYDKLKPIRSINKGRFPSPKGKGFYICEVAMGFRITGDFFDRHWTCHVVENVSDHQSQNDDFAELELDSNTYEHWQQRKVLELILIQRILARISETAQEIIEEVEVKSGVGRNDLFGNPSSEDRNIEDLHEVLRVLFALKNNFASILEN
ncbi:MAG: hypothetical protein Q9164_006870, partial [Protoblastenia rupestris]